MYILAVESSAGTASAAVLQDEKVVSEFTVNAGLTHSQTLLPLCSEALKAAGLKPAQIDLFAVSAGPGSFTGVRIGVSAVKGFAAALSRPCVPVSTLEALSLNLAADGIILCAMDARRSQVYNAVFRRSDGELTRLCDDRAVPISLLKEELSGSKEKIFLVGDGADLCYNELVGSIPRLELAPPHLRLQRASSVGLAALSRARRGETCSAEELMPVYLRLPQAERERLEREGAKTPSPNPGRTGEGNDTDDRSGSGGENR